MKNLTTSLIKLNNMLLSLSSKIVPNILKEFFDLFIDTIQHQKNKVIKKILRKKNSKQQTSSTLKKPLDKQNVKKKLSLNTSWTSSLSKEKNFISIQHIWSGSIMLAISLLAGLQVYHHSKEIIENMGGHSRKPASLKPITRPLYFGNERKHIQISNLQIPIYHKKNPNAVNSIQLEFVLEASNRYLKQYIESNDHEIRDRLHTTLAPMDIEFIETDEGRDVIKAKILYEVNKLIKEKNIKGKIQHISINSILSG